MDEVQIVQPTIMHFIYNVSEGYPFRIIFMESPEFLRGGTRDKTGQISEKK